MAIGDRADILNRVKQLIPKRWFAWVAPNRDAVLGGLSDLSASCYSFIGYAQLQTRLKTAQAPWLDIASYDFLGPLLPRRAGESDPQFSGRLIKEILRPRNTRAAITLALTDLTGRAPLLMEMWNPGDVGAYDVGTVAYDTAGAYGDLALHNQIFVIAFRPAGEGAANIPGYDNPEGGYDIGTTEYTDASMIVSSVSDAQIYAAVAQIISAGCTAWVAIQSKTNINAKPIMVFDDVGNSQYLMLLPDMGL